jgi:hypothetical protein
MPKCQKCQDSKYIKVEFADHTDFNPCEQCIGPVNGCARGHASILFHGTVCPLCACLQELAIAADTEQIARMVRDALEQKLESI